MGKRVVVLGAGVTGEAFVSALRKLDSEAEITVVEHELVGGECSYWACIPSKTLLRPLEVVARARLAPGATEAVGAVDAARVFWWRDQVAGKDDASQADWLANQGAELVRGTGIVSEPGLVTVGKRELPYDALLVATGSVPFAPPIEGLAEAPHWGSREATSANAVPESLAIVGGGAVGCELAQCYARLGSKVTLVQSGDRLLPRMDPEAADILAETFAEEGIELRFGAQATRVEEEAATRTSGSSWRVRSRWRPSGCSSPPAASRMSRASASSGSASRSRGRASSSTTGSRRATASGPPVT